MSDEPRAKRGRLRNSNRLDLRTFWSTANEFVTELRKDGITELLKNGRATGELFSMSGTKFVAEKTTLVLANLHNAWLDEVSAAIRRKTAAGGSGRLASYPLHPASQVEEWFFDFSVFPGNSGGPVFLSGNMRQVGGRFHAGTNLIMGLVTVEHSAIETGEKLMLAGIVPAQFIKETLAMLPNSPAESQK